MLMKCKACANKNTPARKNIINCSKCIIFKKAQNNQREQALNKDQKVNKMMMKNRKVNKMMMKKIEKYRTTAN